MEPSYQGTFTSAKRHVLHTFANTQSPLMKKRVAQYMLSQECALCHGKRLRVESLSVTDVAKASTSRTAAYLAPLLSPD